MNSTDPSECVNVKRLTSWPSDLNWSDSTKLSIWGERRINPRYVGEVATCACIHTYLPKHGLLVPVVGEENKHYESHSFQLFWTTCQFHASTLTRCFQSAASSLPRKCLIETWRHVKTASQSKCNAVKSRVAIHLPKNQTDTVILWRKWQHVWTLLALYCNLSTVHPLINEDLRMQYIL